MNRSIYSSIPPLRAIVSRTILFTLASLAASWTWGADLEGFLEPYKTINVASMIRARSMLYLSKKGSSSRKTSHCEASERCFGSSVGYRSPKHELRWKAEAAKADLKLRKDRLEKLEPLRRQGHARQEEIDRAVYEVALAEANLHTAQEIWQASD